MTRYWKILDANGRACHGGRYQYDLPRWDDEEGWIPGAWTPAIPNIVACRRGYHVCRDQDLVHWLHARIYACEVRGKIIVEDNKVVAESIRLTAPTPWDECSARLFAVECAADVLYLYEREHPNDPRVADALIVAYRYALGDATESELAAAGAATWAATWAAARDAARDAAQTQRLLVWLNAENPGPETQEEKSV